MAGTGSFLIIVGLDGSEHSRAALTWALDEAHRRNGQLRLVTAWNKPAMAWYPAVLETAAGEIAAEESPEHIARTLQEDALKSAENAGVPAAGRLVDTHSPASAILDAASDADLIVIGSRGHGGFPGLRLGSVSAQVVNHAQCPVLVVHSKA